MIALEQSHRAGEAADDICGANTAMAGMVHNSRAGDERGLAQILFF
jgi:hypothetical protein